MVKAYSSRPLELRLKSTSNQLNNIKDLIKLVVLFGDLYSSITFEVFERLVLRILLGTSYIKGFMCSKMFTRARNRASPLTLGWCTSDKFIGQCRNCRGCRLCGEGLQQSKIEQQTQILINRQLPSPSTSVPTMWHMAVQRFSCSRHHVCRWSTHSLPTCKCRENCIKRTSKAVLQFNPILPFYVLIGNF